MEIILKPSQYHGTIDAVSSKSYAQRAIALATLKEEPTIIGLNNLCKDVLSACELAKCMGHDVLIEEENIRINPNLTKKVESIWKVGESGFSARVFTLLAALYDKEITITGKDSLLNRRFTSLKKAMKSAGVDIEMTSGDKFPVKIKGPFSNSNILVDASDTSQVLSGMLLACPRLSFDSTIHVAELASHSYVDVTLDIIHTFGGKIKKEGTIFKINGNQEYITETYDVEGDWSNAAFHLVGGAIGGNVSCCGLNMDTKQGDRAILDVLNKVGAKVEIIGNTVTVIKDQLNRFTFDATNVPDLFPPLVVLASHCPGRSSIKGIKRLRNKESDRLQSLITEFSRLGINIHSKEDVMLVEGGRIRGGRADAQGDHRIAMACAIMSLCAEQSIILEGIEHVDKSYPKFFRDFQNLRIEVS